MKIRLHIEDKESSISYGRVHTDRNRKGLIILESEPQMRTIFINSSHRDSVRLAFPYVYFIVHYRIINGHYYYYGIYDRGLMVFMRKTPIRNLNSKLYFCPLEAENWGVACTIHDLDNSKYDSVFDLAHTIISNWWQSQHAINHYGLGSHEIVKDLNPPKYKEISLYDWEKLQNINWSFAFNLKTNFRLQAYARVFDDLIKIDENTKLINKEFKNENLSY